MSNPLQPLLASPRYKLACLPIPKVGCSSLYTWWSAIHGEDSGLAKVVHPRWTASKVGSLKGYFVFAFVRDPWKRIVSTFLDKQLLHKMVSGAKIRPTCFRKYVEGHYPHPPTAWDKHLWPMWMFMPKGVKFDGVWHLKEMTSRLVDVSQKVGAPIRVKKVHITPYSEMPEWDCMADRPITELNPKKLPPWWAFYDEDLKAKIGEMYAKDISQYGFKYDR